MITNLHVDFVCSSSLDPDLVFTTSTGLATMVAVTPATTALARWQPTPSPMWPPVTRASCRGWARYQPGVLNKQNRTNNNN